MKWRLQGGFSLVELIFAIAIGGLIVVMVFYGLSQARSNKRDDARKEDAHRYLLAAKEWISDNNGILPSGANTDPKCPDAQQYQCVIDSYITNYYLDSGGGAHGPESSFNDPDGAAWQAVWGTATPGSPQAAGGNPQMLVQSQAICQNGDIAVAPSHGGVTGSRQMAVAVQLENGVAYCTSN